MPEDQDRLNKVLFFYGDFFQKIWKKISSIVGEVITEFIINTSIKKILPGFRFLKNLKISSNGVYELKNSVDDSPYVVEKAFQILTYKILTAFFLMCGKAVVNELSEFFRELNIDFSYTESLPKVILYTYEDIEFENKGFNIIKATDIEDLKKKLQVGNIAVVLIEKLDEPAISSLYRFVLEVSPDTEIITSESLPQWPDRNSILQTINRCVLEYLFLKKKRLFLKELLSSTAVAERDKYLNGSILETLRSFNIELSSCQAVKDAIGITKNYIKKIFAPVCFCVMTRIDKYWEISVFNERSDKDSLKKILANFIILNSILMQEFAKGEEIKIFLNNKLYTDFEASSLELCKLLKQDSFSHIVFPIIARKENFGCMALYDEKEFSINEIKKFSFIAYQLANILLSIRLISEIKNVSIKDALTGLYNRRYFDEVLQHEYLRAKRYYFPLSLIMIDIDYFKSINDTFGHLIGDEVLKKLAKLIKDSVRQVDIVARFGGEEFAIILLNTPLEEAANMAERLRNIVQKNEFIVNGYKINITISAGVSSLKKDAFSKDELVEQADKALLTAKAKGRNKVYIYVDEKEIKEIRTKGQRERRRYKRITTELLVNYIPLTIHTVGSGKAISKDISEAGISLKEVQEIPRGEFLLLEFDLPVGLNRKHHMKALAQIVWSKKEREKAIMGAKLITLDPEDKAVLRNLCVYYNEILK